MKKWFKKLFKKKRKPRKINTWWVGTVAAQYQYPDKNTGNIYYHLYENDLGERSYNVGGSYYRGHNYLTPEDHTRYNEVVLPWLESGDPTFIQNMMIKYNVEYWEWFFDDQPIIEKRKPKEKKKPEFKLLKFERPDDKHNPVPQEGSQKE